MNRKTLLVLCTAIFSASSYGLVSGWITWDAGGGEDKLWTTGTNWSRTDGLYPDNTAPNAECNASIGYFNAGTEHVAEITDGMDITIWGLNLGLWTSAKGKLNMHGGTLNVNYINNANNKSTAQGIFNLYGGTVNVTTSIGVARDGIGIMNIEGGTITAKLLNIGLMSTAVGTVYLKGGEMIINYDSPTASNFTIRTGSKIYIGDGLLKYNAGGLYTAADFYTFISQGKILPYGEDPRTQLNVETVDGYIVMSSFLDDTIAAFPSPVNSGFITDPNTVLSWTPGTTAVAHNIYFSEVRTDVENALDTSSPFCIANEISMPQFIIGDGLLLGKTYYWRVDEVDVADNVIKGFIWSFSRLQYSQAIETFDSYATYNDLLAGGWAEEGGAYVDIVSDAANVQAGARAMFIDCYNSSAMTKTFTPVMDWSSGNNSTSLLQVYIKGKLANNVTSAAVIVTDAANRTATLNFSDVSKLTPTDKYDDLWTQWLIQTSEIAAANPLFDLTQVKKMSVSINMVGSGSIYVDSIYLFSSGCYAGLTIGDLTGDCIIDIDDFAFFGRDWLKEEAVLPTATPVVWYKFDETSGSTAADYSGNGYTAAAKAAGATATAVWSNQGKFGGCIEFDGLYCMKFSGSELSALTDQVTVSLWVNGDPKVQPGAGITFAATNVPMAINKQLNAHLPWSSSYVYFDTAGDSTNYDRASWLAPADAYKYGWNHYAFTKNAQTGEQKIYHNGSLVALATGKTRLLDIAEISIGMSTNEISTPYVGRVDDFRIYNVELTAGEILAISGYSRRGDFAGSDNFVNQADLNAMIANWLSQVLWPVE